MLCNPASIILLYIVIRIATREISPNSPRHFITHTMVRTEFMNYGEVYCLRHEEKGTIGDV